MLDLYIETADKTKSRLWSANFIYHPARQWSNDTVSIDVRENPFSIYFSALAYQPGQ